jgi:glyoxylase-like metal-dependent hydrolase (beta-lactamase superfamily II)
MRFVIFLAALFGAATSPVGLAQQPSTQRVFTINDHLIAFYDGRDPSGKRYRAEWNWVDDGAMKLGVATYAIHKGDQAIVFDTFTSVEQARWVRTYLEKRGIRRFTVVLSHWHMDHTGGNAVYRDSHIIAPDVGRATQVSLKDKIEAGEVFGPPGVKPLILPDLAFHGQMDLYLDDLRIELHNLNIHSPDGTVVLIPSDKILLAGDTLEDSVTYIAEAADLPEHIKNLKQLRGMDFERIYPNHGDPEVIRKGGYSKTFIEATVAYITAMLSRVKEQGYLDSALETYIGESVKNGWVNLYEPYRDVHKDNLKAVHKQWMDKLPPKLD